MIAGATITSGGHVTTYNFHGSIVLISVDGQQAKIGQSSDVTAEVQSLCGSGIPFQSLPRLRETARAAIAPNPPAGQTNQEVVTGDFNGDGNSDSAVVTGRGIFVTLQSADGTALSSTLYPITADTGPSIVAVDFNGDGILDLAITQGAAATEAMPSPAGNVVVLLGNGDGTFGPPTSFPVGTVGSPTWQLQTSRSRSRAQSPCCLEKGMVVSPRP